ncbi:MAG: hypothetical protein IPM86_05350 [Saprospiraceae bacterium]|nr:hypothetical protein [Saprospiraceae bacterium]
MTKLHSITLVVKPEQKLNIKWPRQHLRQVITLLTSFYLVCSSVSISAQHASLIFKAELAHELQECSGLIALENGKYFLAHNDSGCEPILYLISQDAKIIHQIRVEGSSHVDWEDMSFDGMKHLYIADCGNNDQSRRGGVINRIDISKGFFVDTVFAEQIKFQFGDYPTTKMKRNKKHFDIEAICTSGDSILMFTKTEIDGSATKLSCICSFLIQNNRSCFLSKVCIMGMHSSMKTKSAVRGAEIQQIKSISRVLVNSFYCKIKEPVAILCLIN